MALAHSELFTSTKNPSAMNAIIKTFRPNLKLSKHHFFIQSRGLHSGRPLKEPISNCFSIELTSNEDHQMYFTLVEALYHYKRFEFYLHGSVIPLIRIGDVKAVIADGLQIVNNQPGAFNKTVLATVAIDKYIINLESQIDLLAKMKYAQLHSLFKPE
jgi:hypothetical protein